MSYKLNNGEYEKIGGELITVEYIEALLQKAILLIKAQRGRFYPDKNFGSRLNEISREPFEEYAAAYIRQALYGLDGVYVKNVTKAAESLTVELMINDEEKEVILPFDENV